MCAIRGGHQRHGRREKSYVMILIALSVLGYLKLTGIGRMADTS
jgi:hypothetical protein